MDLNQIIKQLRDIEEYHKVAIGDWRDASADDRATKVKLEAKIVTLTAQFHEERDKRLYAERACANLQEHLDISRCTVDGLNQINAGLLKAAQESANATTAVDESGWGDDGPPRWAWNSYRKIYKDMWTMLENHRGLQSSANIKRGLGLVELVDKLLTFAEDAWQKTDDNLRNSLKEASKLNKENAKLGEELINLRQSGSDHNAAAIDYVRRLVNAIGLDGVGTKLEGYGEMLIAGVAKIGKEHAESADMIREARGIIHNLYPIASRKRPKDDEEDQLLELTEKLLAKWGYLYKKDSIK